MGFFDDLGDSIRNVTGGTDNELIATGILGRADLLGVDVSGTTQEGVPVDARAVEFATVDLTGAAKGEAIVEAPAVLTEAGAEAFGTYEAGEPLDPITVGMPGSASCLTTQPDPLPGIVAVIAGVAVLIVIALLVVVWRRRAKAAAE